MSVFHIFGWRLEGWATRQKGKIPFVNREVCYLVASNPIRPSPSPGFFFFIFPCLEVRFRVVLCGETLNLAKFFENLST